MRETKNQGSERTDDRQEMAAFQIWIRAAACMGAIKHKWQLLSCTMIMTDKFSFFFFFPLYYWLIECVRLFLLVVALLMQTGSLMLSWGGLINHYFSLIQTQHSLYQCHIKNPLTFQLIESLNFFTRLLSLCWCAAVNVWSHVLLLASLFLTCHSDVLVSWDSQIQITNLSPSHSPHISCSCVLPYV